jgi:hypothetical protein
LLETVLCGILESMVPQVYFIFHIRSLCFFVILLIHVLVNIMCIIYLSVDFLR